MPSKSEIRALIKQRKTGGIADRISGVKYGNRLIDQYMNIARREILTNFIIDAPLTDNFLKTFFPYVYWDAMRNIAYFNLPATVVNIVDENGDNQGLQWVSGRNEENEGWIIRKNMESQYMSQLDGGAHDKQIAYMEGNKVFLPKLLQADLSAGLCVKIKIIGDTNAYTENEEFPIPTRTAAFIDLCCKMMDELKLTPVKSGNDGNPQTA